MAALHKLRKDALKRHTWWSEVTLWYAADDGLATTMTMLAMMMMMTMATCTMATTMMTLLSMRMTMTLATTTM